MDGWAVTQGSAVVDVSEEPFPRGKETDDFETCVEEHPSVIPISELNPTATVAIPIGRQVTIPSLGAADLLFLDDTGRVVVIECKLIENSEARREVIAQLLEYDSRIRQQWNEQRVIAIADEYGQKHGRTSLCDALNEGRKRVAEGKDDMTHLTPAALSRKIREGLRSAAKGPILVVAGNRLEQRALVLSDYLRKLRVPIACVEVRRFRIAGAQFFTGAVRAASLIETLSPSQGAALSREEWLAAVEEEPVASIRQNLLEWAETLEQQGLCSLRFGTVDLLIDVQAGPARRTLCDVWTTKLFTYFSALRRAGWPDADIQRLRGDIETIVGVGHLGHGQEYPSFPLADLTAVENRDRMKELLVSVMQKLVASSGGD